MALEHLALVHALHGRWETSVRLASYADAALAKIGYRRSFTEQTTRDRLTALFEANLNAEDRERFTSEGATLTAEGAVALALEQGP